MKNPRAEQGTAFSLTNAQLAILGMLGGIAVHRSHMFPPWRLSGRSLQMRGQFGDVGDGVRLTYLLSIYLLSLGHNSEEIPPEAWDDPLFVQNHDFSSVLTLSTSRTHFGAKDRNQSRPFALPSGNLLQFAMENGEHGPFSSRMYLFKLMIFHGKLQEITTTLGLPSLRIRGTG